MEIRQDSVVLKKASGATATVPFARLSNADREYLKTVVKAAAMTVTARDVVAGRGLKNPPLNEKA